MIPVPSPLPIRLSVPAAPSATNADIVMPSPFKETQPREWRVSLSLNTSQEEENRSPNVRGSDTEKREDKAMPRVTKRTHDQVADHSKEEEEEEVVIVKKTSAVRKAKRTTGPRTDTSTRSNPPARKRRRQEEEEGDDEPSPGPSPKRIAKRTSTAAKSARTTRAALQRRTAKLE